MNKVPSESLIVIVMGVSGCGKSTIASLIAQSLKFEFLDADDLHPPENKQMMSAGIPLTDENRLPWLETVRDYATSRSSKNESCVIACSALKQSYRDILNQAHGVCYVFLDGPKSLIQQRMHDRTGHFMPESLLDSQYDALERPEHENRVVTVKIDSTPQEIADNAVIALEQSGLRIQSGA